MPLNGLGNSRSFDAGLALQGVIEAAQKFPPRARVIFPGVFSIKNDRNDGVMSRLWNRLSRLLNILHEVIGGVLRGHARIDETNEVGNGVVAKKQIHLRLLFFEAMNGIKPGRQIAGQLAGAGTSERDSET